MNATSSPVRDRLIDHALEAEPGPGARASARVWLEDTLAVGIAGCAHPDRPTIARVVQGFGDGSDARTLGDGICWPTVSAAMLNAWQIHNQEFDCVHEPAVVHPMAVIGGSLLTWSDAQGGIGGRHLLDAIVVAVDAAATLGLMAIRPMRFFRPAMCGALGAVLGLSRLAMFDIETTRKALGLVWTQLSGNMQAHLEGSPALAMQIGFNARAAVGAVELAAAGVAGPEDSIDGPFGYLELIEGEFDPAPLARIGRINAVTEISHKPWPTGRAAHGALEGLRLLLAEGLEPEQVESLELVAPPLVRRLIDRPARADMHPAYARLCLPWMASVCLARGDIGLDDFAAKALSDSRRGRFADRVTIAALDEDTDDNALTPQVLTVTTRAGQRHQHRLESVLGSPGNPLDVSARRAKAAVCCDFAGLSRQRQAELLDAVADLERCNDIRSLVDLTRPEAE